jgi:hypothetical protein
MAKESPKAKLFKDKEDTVENLEAIQMVLQQCINDGMLDENAHFYNEILVLIDEASLVKADPELDEVISKAQTLETDIDAWLSMHRRETLSLTWPRLVK